MNFENTDNNLDSFDNNLKNIEQTNKLLNTVEDKFNYFFNKNDINNENHIKSPASVQIPLIQYEYTNSSIHNNTMPVQLINSLNYNLSENFSSPKMVQDCKNFLIDKPFQTQLQICNSKLNDTNKIKLKNNVKPVKMNNQFLSESPVNLENLNNKPSNNIFSLKTDNSLNWQLTKNSHICNFQNPIAKSHEDLYTFSSSNENDIINANDQQLNDLVIPSNNTVTKIDYLEFYEKRIKILEGNVALLEKECEASNKLNEKLNEENIKLKHELAQQKSKKNEEILEKIYNQETKFQDQLDHELKNKDKIIQNLNHQNDLLLKRIEELRLEKQRLNEEISSLRKTIQHAFDEKEQIQQNYQNLLNIHDQMVQIDINRNIRDTYHTITTAKLDNEDIMNSHDSNISNIPQIMSSTYRKSKLTNIDDHNDHSHGSDYANDFSHNNYHNGCDNNNIAYININKNNEIKMMLEAFEDYKKEIRNLKENNINVKKQFLDEIEKLRLELKLQQENNCKLIDKLKKQYLELQSIKSRNSLNEKNISINSKENYDENQYETNPTTIPANSDSNRINVDSFDRKDYIEMRALNPLKIENILKAKNKSFLNYNKHNQPLDLEAEENLKTQSSYGQSILSNSKQLGEKKSDNCQKLQNTNPKMLEDDCAIEFNNDKIRKATLFYKQEKSHLTKDIEVNEQQNDNKFTPDNQLKPLQSKINNEHTKTRKNPMDLGKSTKKYKMMKRSSKKADRLQTSMTMIRYCSKGIDDNQFKETLINDIGYDEFGEELKLLKEFVNSKVSSINPNKELENKMTKLNNKQHRKNIKSNYA